MGDPVRTYRCEAVRGKAPTCGMSVGDSYGRRRCPHPATWVIFGSIDGREDKAPWYYACDTHKGEIVTGQPSAKATEFVGVPSGDCECFCWDVTPAEYERVTGEPPDGEEPGRTPGTVRLYPRALMPAESNGKACRIRVAAELTPVPHAPAPAGREAGRE